MANVLKREKQILVLQHLIEGNTIRSTERLTGVHRDTIMRTLVRFGESSERFLNSRIVNVKTDHVELDETWTWVGKKDKRLTKAERDRDDLGSQYLFLGICAKSKLIVSHVVGKRNGETTREFVDDLSRRVWLTPDRTSDQRPQLSTDGWSSYYPAIREAFTGTVRHGVIIKNYSDPEVGRYAPPELNRARRFSINGIKELWTVCTSHIERFNLTVRTFLKRFTRLALGFSKKLDNLKASVSAFIAFYNFCWRTRHKGNSGKLRPTAAMMAGLTDRLWSFTDLFDAVQAAEKDRKSNERYARLAAKLAERN